MSETIICHRCHFAVEDDADYERMFMTHADVCRECCIEVDGEDPLEAS